MELGRLLPIGNQSFAKIRRINAVYVDKTDLVWRMTRSQNVCFFARPRRFGKSLLLNTIKEYFAGRRELFDGLAIQPLQDAESGENWPKHPVLHLSFARANYFEEGAIEKVLEMALTRFERDHGLPNASGQDYLVRMVLDLEEAQYKLGEEAVLVIDEYDKPLVDTFTRDKESEQWKLHESLTRQLRGIYNCLKDMDDTLRYVFITGITRFSRLGIFSGLNNLEDLTLDPAYASICGITHEELLSNFRPELDRWCREKGVEQAELVKELQMAYDGYRFTSSEVLLYNPFGLLNSLKSCEMNYYWYLSGARNALQQIMPGVLVNWEDLEQPKLLAPGSMAQMGLEAKDPAVLLFQTGYYTVKAYDAERNLYQVGIPNAEVRFALYWEVSQQQDDKLAEQMNMGLIFNFVRYVRNEDIEGFMGLLKHFLNRSPYAQRDEGEDVKDVKEYIYHSVTHLLFELMGQYVHSEVPSAKGRTDLELETEGAVYVFEFKTTRVKDALAAAMEQIASREYAERHVGGGKRVFAVGVVFGHDGVAEWSVEEVRG
ncbi:MAG: hypothetical protein CSA97_00715 [Bacteroidetes bacterium]|nr:MAG: hypothetical protein CSA97_00715 [Bacteroidota bacterium]